VATVSAVLGEGQDATVAGLPSDPTEARLPDAHLSLDVSRARLTTQGLTLLRSSYGGLAMLGFLGAFAGIAVAAPVMAAAGLLFGGKGLKDERSRQLAARRSAAKVSVRRYLDEVSFALGKESRDTLRHTQRTLREHFSARAEEVQRSAAEALRAAKEAAAADAADRAARLADVEAELRRLAALEDRARRLAGEPQPVPA
jgi:gas vesicle protein